MVHVDLGALVVFLAAEVMVDAVGGNRGLADGRGQQVWAHDVAADEIAGFVWNLVELVSVDQSTAIVEILETSEVATLADGRYHEIALDIEFRAFLFGHLAIGPVDFDDTQGLRTAVLSDHQFYRCEAAADFYTFPFGRDDFVFGGRHLFDRAAVDQ